MRKSDKENMIEINGRINADECTITEVTSQADLVWNFNELVRSFNNKEVSIVIKEKKLERV
jgi:hypothetical protein